MPRLIMPRKLPNQTQPLSEASWEILRKVDETLSDPKRAAQVKYRELRSPLRRIPRAERGIDYVERVIKIYCIKGMRGPRCFSLKTKIGEAREKAGEQEKFEAFTEELGRILHPLTLTNHGFQTPFKSLDRAASATELKRLSDGLFELGYQHFINSGTLLGSVRDGDFIGHDDDIDLGVFISGGTIPERYRALYELRTKLTARFPDYEVWFSQGGPIVKVQFPAGLTVDLFIAWVADRKVYVWPHTYGDLTEDDVFPLGSSPLQGIDFPAPRNADKMLSVNYGPNWRVPDPNFVFSWRDAKIRFRDFLKYYRFKRKIAKWINRLPFIGRDI